MAAGQVVLADGSVHGQRVLGHMGGEGAVGEVDAVVRAAVDDDRLRDGSPGRAGGRGTRPGARRLEDPATGRRARSGLPGHPCPPVLRGPDRHLPRHQRWRVHRTALVHQDQPGRSQADQPGGSRARTGRGVCPRRRHGAGHHRPLRRADLLVRRPDRRPLPLRRVPARTRRGHRFLPSGTGAHPTRAPARHCPRTSSPA
jgi:hypothetical protein